MNNLVWIEFNLNRIFIELFNIILCCKLELHQSNFFILMKYKFIRASTIDCKVICLLLILIKSAFCALVSDVFWFVLQEKVNEGQRIQTENSHLLSLEMEECKYEERAGLNVFL